VRRRGAVRIETGKRTRRGCGGRERGREGGRERERRESARARERVLQTFLT
jgi:hypothetical protein